MAFVITSVAASIAGIQLVVLWFNIAEMIRVGNDHLGQSRAFPTSSRYLVVMFSIGVTLFWFAALRQYRHYSHAQVSADDFLLLNS